MSRVHHRHRARILKRDNHRCKLCMSGREVDIHHIVPQEEGGKTEDDNLISLCKQHHDLMKLAIFDREKLKALVKTCTVPERFP